MTLEEVIKLLPVKEELKLKILKMYPYMDSAQQLTIQRIAWTNYDVMREEAREFNTAIMHDKVKNGEESYSEDFDKIISDMNDKELQEEIEESKSSIDLASARQAMQQIVKEMQDAKHAKAAKKPQVEKN